MPKKKTTQFFVSITDGPKLDLLAGPYKTHARALAEVDRVWRIALDTWSEAAFCSVGTVGINDGRKRTGLLNQMGLV